MDKNQQKEMIRNAIPGDIFTAPGEFALLISRTSISCVLVLSEAYGAATDIVEFQLSELDHEVEDEDSCAATVTYIPWV